MASGYDYSGAAVPNYDYSGGSSGFSGWLDGAANLGGANPAMFDGGRSTPFFDPNLVGQPPVGDATVGSVAPNQGSSVVGSPFGGSAGDLVDSDNSESVSDALRSGRDGFAYSSTPGMSGGANPDASVASSSPAPPPTAWESIKQVPGKWWQGAQEAPGKMAESFNRDPFGNSLRIASAAAPFAVAGIQAGMQPGALKARSLPQLPAQFTPANEPIPAASSMSPLTGAGPAGGFSVKPNVGLKKNFAEGGFIGDVGYNLSKGGKVSRPNFKRGN